MFTKLDPKLDVVFKMMFARPDCKGILIALLTAILRPKTPIRSVTVLNHLLARRHDQALPVSLVAPV
ncbi:MAG: hypothetical protein HY898_28230 [Deltaproteobacteria bacterium]|nr:hypothetical protein [Deltaproteobacteria bacterium]